MDKETRLLILSGRCLGKSTPNGRLLLNLLSDFNKHNVLSIFFNPSSYGKEEIKNSICIRPKDAVLSCLTFGVREPKPLSEADLDQNAKAEEADTPRRILNNSIKYSLPNAIGKKVKKAIRALDPQVIIVSVNENPFVLKLARKISKKTGTPLIVAATDDFPMKDYDFVQNKSKHTFFSKILLRKLSREMKKTFLHASSAFFNSPVLESAYLSKYKVNNPNVVYNQSEKTPEKRVNPKDINSIVFAGKLNVGRYQSLIDFANRCFALKSTVRVNVYSPTKVDQTKAPRNVVFHDLVSHEELQEIYNQSDMIVHVESFDPYYAKDMKYSFSSKICDSLLSGKPLFLYGPNNAGMDFVRGLTEEFTATSDRELRVKLEEILGGDVSYEIDDAKVQRQLSLDHNSQAIGNLIRSYSKH